MAQCFRFGGRRCSPLNWALCIMLRNIHLDAFVCVL
ncbi:acetyltransferase [Vibrio parahaemolyticus]|nr:acetyltransferase [Vibrio parahaemolyticus]TBT70971.1 acetyltransferase [Vibrio parahaemolyticus]